jgi:exopolysaccharide production protein ExoQ
MAALATVVCLVVIALLLIRDSGRRAGLSAATWLPTLMIFTLGSRSPSHWLGQSVPNALIDQLYFASLIAASLLILSSRSVQWSKLFAANIPILMFYGYFALSSLWSSHPADSAIRVFKDLGSTAVMVLVIFSEKNPLLAIRAVYVRCACVALPLSLLFTRVSRFGKTYDRGGNLMYNGVAETKNSLGGMLMVCILFLVWDHLESRPRRAKWLWSGMRWDRLVLLLIGAWLLYLSQSKTSLVCTVIGLALIRARGWLASRMTSTIIFAIALSLPFLLLLTQQFGTVISPLLESVGRDSTFTGRASTWSEIGLTTVNPLIGAGFYNYWGGEGGQALAEKVGAEATNAHDGYLETYLDGGVIGLVVLLVLLVASAKRIIGDLSLEGFRRLRFVFLIVTLVGNLTESFFGRLSPLWFTTVIVFINYPFRAKWGPEK